MKTREPALVSLSDGLISSTLIEGIEWRGFGEPSREVVVCRKSNLSHVDVRTSWFSCFSAGTEI